MGKEGNMKKARMVCPFTGGRCVRCSLYRGRHKNLCFYAQDQNANGNKNIQKDPRWEKGRIVKTPYPGKLFLNKSDFTTNVEDNGMSIDLPIR
jgi:hypothetical protein